MGNSILDMTDFPSGVITAFSLSKVGSGNKNVLDQLGIRPIHWFTGSSSFVGLYSYTPINSLVVFDDAIIDELSNSVLDSYIHNFFTNKNR